MKQIKRKTTADALLATQKQILDELDMLKRNHLNAVNDIVKRLDGIEKQLRPVDDFTVEERHRG